MWWRHRQFFLRRAFFGGAAGVARSPVMLATPVVRQLSEHVYEPSEDSFLLLDCFEQDRGFVQRRFGLHVPLVVEVGSGSGIVLTFVRQHVLPLGLYIATDVNPHACRAVLRTAKDNGGDRGIDLCQMDLTSAIRRRTVDVLIFNPPYVPAETVPAVPNTEDDDTWLDLALCGGPQGMDVTWRVLDGLDATLSRLGVAYVLFCARNRPSEVKETLQLRGWSVEVVIERKAGWEVLCVMRIARAGDQETEKIELQRV